MLRSALHTIAPGLSERRAVWPWILVLGVRNRRRYSGLQLCPCCLAEDHVPYVRRFWRYAWHVGCNVHRCLLLDHCKACHAPIEPHRCKAVDLVLSSCATCGTDLRKQRTGPADEEALGFQAAADGAFYTGTGIWVHESQPVDRWFRLAYANATRPLRAPEIPDAAPHTGLSLMLQRTSERASNLARAYQVMVGASPGVKRPHAWQTPKRFKAPCSTRAEVDSGDGSRPRPRHLVEGEWIRMLRRLRLVMP